MIKTVYQCDKNPKHVAVDERGDVGPVMSGPCPHHMYESQTDNFTSELCGGMFRRVKK